jgi:hypothetical protein
VESFAALSPIAQPGSVKPVTLSKKVLIPRLNRKKTPMFDLGAPWTVLTQALTPASLGWVIAGIVILFALKSLMDRAGQPTRPVAHVLEEAARLNAARAAPPRVDHSPAIANSKDSSW